jgi:hypothetical protein
VSTVVASPESPDGTRCVDLIERDDGSFTFKECRRDPEDGGRWTLIADFSSTAYATREAALDAAAAKIPWFGALRRAASS